MLFQPLFIVAVAHAMVLAEDAVANLARRQWWAYEAASEEEQAGWDQLADAEELDYFRDQMESVLYDVPQEVRDAISRRLWPDRWVGVDGAEAA